MGVVIVKPTSKKPRGILNSKAGEPRTFSLALYPPEPDLEAFVEHYWVVRWDLREQEPYLSETLPHPSVHMTIEKGKSRITGVMTGRFSYLLEGQGIVVGAKFKPGAFYPFVNAQVAKFTDLTMGLQDVFGVQAEELEAAILSQGSEQEMIASLEEFLRQRLPESDENIALVNKILDRIASDREITKVDDIANRLNINKRTLQRIFSRYVGVSPKWVIKRCRLHEAAEQIASGQIPGWSTLAADLGYYDQAHFIKDFKTIVGKSPEDYAKKIGALPADSPQ